MSSPTQTWSEAGPARDPLDEQSKGILATRAFEAAVIRPLGELGYLR
jgi:hypothetical protein